MLIKRAVEHALDPSNVVHRRFLYRRRMICVHPDAYFDQHQLRKKKNEIHTPRRSDARSRYKQEYKVPNCDDFLVVRPVELL
jgi:hypothetical protein